ncbi:hypothetical protein BCR33DRAFT_40736 [Rhizoclosmatium globosum]|uniref:Dynactin subunit 6 n=1 Tax=Rhizoclosmatium globosum TaxID=329046 RepID=A0A1Y2CNW4_9FUNG|nr:hypothetical protein BCR33DRAFT_40736 [Rhizoclosmatium globosum]|eukprot:ORY48646.1 hypothetical protein BCR33DRAFT_40736 [Rhizoclosmatium globosum]
MQSRLLLSEIYQTDLRIWHRTAEDLHIGDENIFECGSVFEGSGMGSGCVLEPKATVMSGTSIGDNCVIGTSCSTWPNEKLASNTVIYGLNNERRTQTGRNKEQTSLHLKHVEYLKDVLKRFHAQKAGVTQTIGVVS